MEIHYCVSGPEDSVSKRSSFIVSMYIVIAISIFQQEILRRVHVLDV